MKCKAERTVILTMTIEESRALYKVMGSLTGSIKRSLELSDKQAEILDAMADEMQIIYV